jgi:hypothetical protein
MKLLRSALSVDELWRSHLRPIVVKRMMASDRLVGMFSGLSMQVCARQVVSKERMVAGLVSWVARALAFGSGSGVRNGRQLLAHRRLVCFKFAVYGKA